MQRLQSTYAADPFGSKESCRKGHLGRPSQTPCFKPSRTTTSTGRNASLSDRPEPLDYLFDLATPGYGVEFTWRTVGVR